MRSALQGDSSLDAARATDAHVRRAASATERVRMRRIIGSTWVTDLTHLIDDTGGLNRLLTGPGRRLAQHMTAIVAAATIQGFQGTPSCIRCRRRPQRRPCPGSIQYRLRADERKTWSRPSWGD